MKALSLPVSENKNFEISFLCSYVPNCDLQEKATFDLGEYHMYNMVEVDKEMLYTKYESTMTYCFREEEFWRSASLSLCSNFKFGRGPLEDATYQMSKL